MVSVLSTDPLPTILLGRKSTHLTACSFVVPYIFFFLAYIFIAFTFVSVFILTSAALLDYHWLGLQVAYNKFCDLVI